MNVWRIRLGLTIASVFAVSPLLLVQAQNPKAPDKNQFCKGNVVPLAKVLEMQDIKLDPDASPTSLVLQTEDGKVYPLVKDSGSRMFYRDARLLNRPMRLTARPVANGSMLQAINVHSYVKGKLHDVYYWCDICTIKTYENDRCACCLAPVELREVPAKD